MSHPEPDLSYLLNAPGATKQIGKEFGKERDTGISRYRSEQNSFRYVYFINGVPVSALQIVKKRGDKIWKGVIANVWTDPKYRRQGFASKLLDSAKRDFDVIEHSRDLSYAGSQWKSAMQTKDSLKECIREIISESKNSIIVYHGSKFAIDHFNLDNIGREEAIDQEGPGLYFTSMLDDAMRYGNYIHKIQASNIRLINGKKLNMAHVRKMIVESPGWIDEEHFANWGDTPKKALLAALHSIKNYSKDTIDAFQTVWHDFYRYHPQQYAINMVKLGYDGFTVQKNKGFHLIIYNPNKIQIIDSEYVKNE